LSSGGRRSARPLPTAMAAPIASTSQAKRSSPRNTIRSSPVTNRRANLGCARTRPEADSAFFAVRGSLLCRFFAVRGSLLCRFFAVRAQDVGPASDGERWTASPSTLRGRRGRDCSLQRIATSAFQGAGALVRLPPLLSPPAGDGSGRREVSVGHVATKLIDPFDINCALAANPGRDKCTGRVIKAVLGPPAPR